MPASALAAILADVVRTGVPEVHERKAVQEARDLVADADTSYGRMQRAVEVAGKRGGKTGAAECASARVLVVDLLSVRSIRGLHGCMLPR